MAYETILTNVGLQKIASATPEHQLKINRIAVGDGNGGYSPLDPDMTELVNEVWRGPASAPIRDRNDATIIIFEGQIPANVGGFFIREVGIFDDTGDLIAIGHTAATEKPQDTSGTALTLTVRFRVKLSNASETELIYSDEAPIDHQGTNNRDAPDAHPISSITGLDNALNGKADKSTFVFAGTGLTGGGALSSNVTLSVDFGTGAGKVTEGNDERLSNAREWTAETVSQAEAEAGTATTRRAWTAQRVRQAIVAAYNALTSAFGRTLANASDATAARNTLGLGTAATRDVGTGANNVIVGNDTRLSDAREWTASTVSQAEAEAGTSTTRRAWTAQRVRQAIVAGYNALTSAFGRALANASDATSARNTLGLGTAATRDVTTSPTDATGGRVLKVGDGGILARPSGGGSFDFDDPEQPTHLAEFIVTNATGLTPPDVSGATVLRQVYRTGFGKRWYSDLVISNADTGGRVFSRAVGHDGTQITEDTGWREHYHTGNVDDLISGLNLVPASRTISTGTGLTGGGNLSANRTISLASSHWPIGVGQTWQDVTSSRSANTTYTNSTGRPILVNMRIKVTSSSGDRGAEFFVNNVARYSVEGTGLYSGYEHNFTILIPSGSTYRFAHGASTQKTAIWELR